MKCFFKIKTSYVKGKPHPTGKGGKRADLGDVYFRSRWEANWARYLNFLVEQGEISRWEFEPDTFEFPDIKRGTRHYTPDFKVFKNDGTFFYQEVKGWMTPQSETKIKRFKKRNPTLCLQIVDKTRYRSVAAKLGKILPNWESNSSHGIF